MYSRSVSVHHTSPYSSPPTPLDSSSKPPWDTPRTLEVMGGH
jgi:hypothetical protein